MKPNYKPILFSTPMVQALDRKTQTRRVIKPQPDSNLKITPQLSNEWDGKQDYPLTLIFCNEGTLKASIYAEAATPLCEPGDILWVRETWKVGAWNDEDNKIAFDYAASPELKKTPWVEYQDVDRFEEIHLKTIEELDKLGIEPSEIDEENEKFYYKWEPGESPLKWKPSIHMPKEAARHFLEVTNVRAERLQDITAVDAEAEGVVIDASKLKFVKSINPIVQINTAKIFAFASLWNSLNRKYSWESNPWVWVYEFKKIEKPEVWPL